MEEENPAPSSDVKRPGKWRERLELENARLEAENADLREKALKDEVEITRLEERLRMLMDEAVTREQQVVVSA
jgi:hypothetical protein